MRFTIKKLSRFLILSNMSLNAELTALTKGNPIQTWCSSLCNHTSGVDPLLYIPGGF
jgi:hypothetical protein